jgi:glycosyltransferase involved in cell wall biosynthesis
MAAGVPVIATDVGGVRELISVMSSGRQAQWGARSAELSTKGGKFEVCQRGIMVNPGDVDGFANGLRYLLEHPDLYKQMGQRGREYALTHHSKERLIADMDLLYRSLL